MPPVRREQGSEGKLWEGCAFEMPPQRGLIHCSVRAAAILQGSGQAAYYRGFERPDAEALDALFERSEWVSVSDLSEIWTIEEAGRIAAVFDLPNPIECRPFPGKGNIHGDTFLVSAGSDGIEYILQRINHKVFTRPHSVMASMMASLNAQRDYLDRNRLP